MPLIDELANAFDHKTRLIHLIESGILQDRLTLTISRPELFTQPTGVARYQSIGCFQDSTGGAVVLFQFKLLSTGEILSKGLNILHLGTPPAIDRLIIITHNKEVVAPFAEQSQPSVLNGIGILKLINQYMLETLTVVQQHIGTITQQLMGT